ncbi:MAG: SDR family NAD(P)-dependent oxidoreductase [Clostridia bacterium]
MSNIAIVTGGSSGIGKATVKMLADNGYKVYELSRSGYSENGIMHITTDVTKSEDVTTAVRQIVGVEGRIDLLINNAGFGISGAVEFTDSSDAQAQLNVNFFGTLHCIQAVLPIMRAQRSGHIINLSSVAAPIAIPFQAFYSATKSAINSLTLSLRNEVRPFGIQVCAVQPGDVCTGFTAARKRMLLVISSMGRRSYMPWKSWNMMNRMECRPKPLQSPLFTQRKQGDARRSIRWARNTSCSHALPRCCQQPLSTISLAKFINNVSVS